jgi:hypothetical protein
MVEWKKLRINKIATGKAQGQEYSEKLVILPGMPDWLVTVLVLGEPFMPVIRYFFHTYSGSRVQRFPVQRLISFCASRFFL